MSADWRRLLTLAKSHLSSVGASRSDWVWGDGTVLMLRHQHRLSKDIDLFLNDPQLLTMLSPRLNDAIAGSVTGYEESGHHLRLFAGDLGEIDYLVVVPVIELQSERMEVEGHGPIQTMPDREILAQKLYYRAAGFTGRDLFDFATVTRRRPELLEDRALVEVAQSRRNALEARLDTEAVRSAFDVVKRHPEGAAAPSFEEARGDLRLWLEGGAPRPRPAPSQGPGLG